METLRRNCLDESGLAGLRINTEYGDTVLATEIDSSSAKIDDAIGAVGEIDEPAIPGNVNGATTCPGQTFDGSSNVIVKYLNNLVEQEHRAIKRRTRSILGFKAFRCARILLGGIEVMHMIAKGQMKYARATDLSAADQFYSLAM